MLLDRYKGLLETLLTMESKSPAKVFTERFQSITQRLPLSAANETIIIHLVVDYIHGFSLAKSCDTSNTLSNDDIDNAIKLICNSVSDTDLINEF